MRATRLIEAHATTSRCNYDSQVGALKLSGGPLQVKTCSYALQVVLVVPICRDSSRFLLCLGEANSQAFEEADLPIINVPGDTVFATISQCG
jgi:hypothetical protein